MPDPGDLSLIPDAQRQPPEWAWWQFNADDPETIVNFIPNAVAWEWMKVNMPLFECPDKNFERIYYFRWWTFRKHIKQITNSGSIGKDQLFVGGNSPDGKQGGAYVVLINSSSGREYAN